jgi:hypothetical protein
LTLKPLNGCEWVHHEAILTQHRACMTDIMLLACLYRIDEHRLGVEGHLSELCGFCMCLQQTSVATHMGANFHLDTPHMGDKRTKCMASIIIRAAKCPACMKPSVALIFLSSCASYKQCLQAPKSFFCNCTDAERSHGISEHCPGRVSVPCFQNFFPISIWTSLDTTVVPQVTCMHVEVLTGWLAPCFTHHKRQAQPDQLVRYLDFERLPNSLGDVCEQVHHVDTPFGYVYLLFKA